VIRGLIAGKFDPPHEGHLDHAVKASSWCDFLITIVQSDEGVRAVKGKCEVPFYARAAYMQGLLLYYGIKGDVFMGLDADGLSVKSLKHFLAAGDRFIKGGDRTVNNMPLEELNVCKSLGIEIVYGVGDLLNASSKIKIMEE